MADKTLLSNTNTIFGGFTSGRSCNYFQRKYARHVLAINVTSLRFLRGVRGETWVNITFLGSGAIRTNPHDNDPMVITVRHGNWDIKWVLIDPRSSVDDLFWVAFQKLHLNYSEVKVFRGSLVGLSGKKVQVRAHKNLEITCDEGENTKEIEACYFIIDVVSYTTPF